MILFIMINIYLVAANIYTFDRISQNQMNEYFLDNFYLIDKLSDNEYFLKILEILRKAKSTFLPFINKEKNEKNIKIFEINKEKYTENCKNFIHKISDLLKKFSEEFENKKIDKKFKKKFLDFLTSYISYIYERKVAILSIRDITNSSLNSQFLHIKPHINISECYIKKILDYFLSSYKRSFKRINYLIMVFSAREAFYNIYLSKFAGIKNQINIAFEKNQKREYRKEIPVIDEESEPEDESDSNISIQNIPFWKSKTNDLSKLNQEEYDSSSSDSIDFLLKDEINKKISMIEFCPKIVSNYLYSKEKNI